MISQVSSPTIQAEFLTFSQEGIDYSGLQNHYPLMIYALTVQEDLTINVDPNEGEYFIYCSN